MKKELFLRFQFGMRIPTIELVLIGVQGNDDASARCRNATYPDLGTPHQSGNFLKKRVCFVM